MSDPKCARLLLKAAETDLRALRAMRDDDAFTDEIAGFHAQQDAEKLFKAWIAMHGLVFPLTHDLEALLAILKDHEADADCFRDLLLLNPYAVRLRYEGISEGALPLDRERLVSRLGALLARVGRELLAKGVG